MADTSSDQHADFERELAALLNRHSIENQSNTPDWILARYLVECLAAWEHAAAQREHWYGEFMRPGMGEVGDQSDGTPT